MVRVIDHCSCPPSSFLVERSEVVPEKWLRELDQLNFAHHGPRNPGYDLVGWSRTRMAGSDPSTTTWMLVWRCKKCAGDKSRWTATGLTPYPGKHTEWHNRRRQELFSLDSLA